MMSVKYRKCKVGYKFPKSQEQTKYLMYVDNIKILVKTDKELMSSIRIESQKIGIECGFETYALLIRKKINSLVSLF